ncbi:ankyrin repeat-containing domain protein [Aspergillus californicus]
MAMLLLNWGADRTAKRSLRRTPIMYASLHDDPKIIELLLHKGADPADASKAGGNCTAFRRVRWPCRVRQGTPAIITRQGDALDQCHQTPLFAAAVHGHLGIFDTLLSHNANPICTDRYGSTPLSAAARAGHTDVAKRLITLTDDPINLTDGLCRTLLWWASKGGEATIMAIIRDWARERGLETDDLDFSRV